MDSFNHQSTIKKMWGVKDKDGYIKIKSVRCKSFNCKECPRLCYAYHVTQFFGQITHTYLGKCDRLGRPLRSNEATAVS